VHISNRYLDLVPVLVNVSKSYGLSGVVVDDFIDGIKVSRYVVLARDAKDLAGIKINEMPLDSFESNIPVWTDNYSNILQIFNWKNQ
jgi:hypothetical protein